MPRALGYCPSFPPKRAEASKRPRLATLGSYKRYVSKSEARRGGRGRPPLPELILAAPKITPFTPEQRAQFVALLTDMIVNYRQEQHLERARAAVAQAGAHPPGEPPGHSLAP